MPGRPFKKGEGGRPKGARNKVTAAVALQVAQDRLTPLEAMLNVMDFYYRRWKKAEEEQDRQRSAEMTLRAAAMASPYVHPKKLIVEEEHTPVVNVIDKREHGRMLTINGHSNGHGGNGSNGHGGSNGSNGSSNGHGPNGHTNGGSQGLN